MLLHHKLLMGIFRRNHINILWLPLNINIIVKKYTIDYGIVAVWVRAAAHCSVLPFLDCYHTTFQEF